MIEIREIPQKDFGQFIEIMAEAYPGVGIDPAKDKEKMIARIMRRRDDPGVSYQGAYRAGRLRAGIVLFDFKLNFFGTEVLAGGGGSLAVGLIDKKQHLAKQLMRFYFQRYRKSGSPLAVLWQFSPKFYRKMGAGFGTRGYWYVTNPTNLPGLVKPRHIRKLGEKDLASLNECYNRFVARTPGAIAMPLLSRQIQKDLYPGIKRIGYVSKGQVRGYFQYDFVKDKQGDMLDNDMDVKEIVFDSPAVLAELLAFLRNQADQFDRLNIMSYDEDFFALLDDPRADSHRLIRPVYHECHQTTLGMMYRVLDVGTLIKACRKRDFNGGTLRLGLHIKDTFVRANSGKYVIAFRNGQARASKSTARTDVDLRMDIADFSTLIMGACRFRSLYDYGLIKISDDKFLPHLEQLFAVAQKPICLTDF